MYKLVKSILLLFIAASTTSAQGIFLKNPSFETGTPAIFNAAPSWSLCPGGTPDLLDGNTIALCNVSPSDGNQYIGLLATGWLSNGGLGMGEWITQDLSEPIKAGVEYNISIDLASSSSYNWNIGGTDTSLHAMSEVYLQIRGLPDTCTNTGTELLWQSPTKIVRNNTFSRYEICFTPTSDHNTIGFVAYQDIVTAAPGNVLLDNISSIVPTSSYEISIESAILDSTTCDVAIKGKASYNPNSIELSGGFIGSSTIPAMLNDSDWMATINYATSVDSDNILITGIFGCAGITLTDNINIDLSTCNNTPLPNDSILLPLDTPLTIDLYIPNAFSPNSDGVNDRLMVRNIDPIAIEYIRIFNQWGSLVYEGNSLAEGWDGNHKNGNPHPEGVYLYILKAENNQTVYRGTINLIR